MIRCFSLGAALLAMGLSLSADRPSGARADKRGFIVERTDIAAGALMVAVDRKCIESTDGRWPRYRSVTLDALCLMNMQKVSAISYMRIALFGRAAANEGSERPAWTSPGVWLDEVINDSPITGYTAHGRLFTYLDDVGQPLAFGTFSLETSDRNALLPLILCETGWRGGTNLVSLRLTGARCRSHGIVQGVKLFVIFDLLAPTSRTAFENALTRTVMKAVTGTDLRSGAPNARS